MIVSLFLLHFSHDQQQFNLSVMELLRNRTDGCNAVLCADNESQLRS